MGSVTLCPLLPPPHLSQVWIPSAQQEHPAAPHCLQLLRACCPLSSGQRLSGTLQRFPLKYPAAYARLLDGKPLSEGLSLPPAASQ